MGDTWQQCRSCTLAMLIFISGVSQMSSRLALYENGVLVKDVDITTLADHLGPQNFGFNVSGTDVIVSKKQKQWQCRMKDKEKAEWIGKIVLFNRRAWCPAGVEQMYRRLNKTNALMIVKVSRYSPPGMWYYVHSGFGAKTIDTGMVLAQVYHGDVRSIMKKLEDATEDGTIDSYRLVAAPDANKWKERRSYWGYYVNARIMCPFIYLATAVRAAINLFFLLRAGCAVATIDVTHISLFLDLLRSLSMCVFLVEDWGTWLPWKFTGAFLTGMPGLALFSWSVTALKWREVRMATAKNRPIQNTLKKYPKTIVCCTLLLASDLYVYYAHSSSATNSYRLYVDALCFYGICGVVVCSYLLRQGVKVLWKLRAKDVSELDQELVRAFRSMTMWLMVGACGSSTWLVVVLSSAYYSWFWTLENHSRFYMFVQYSLGFTSWAYVTSLTPLIRSADAVVERFGKWWIMQDAATAAAFLGDACDTETGDVDVNGLIKRGIASFRGIRLSELTKEDFASNRSEVTPEGGHMSEVDWFISHSWHDAVDPKWEILQTLAQTFEREHGREPVMWIDKFCIDQNNISASLMYLPIYLLLCKRMVVLAGETYTSRLWCNWELYMCYGLGSRPMIEVEFLPVGVFSLTHFADYLAEFDITDADCFLASDKEKMLEVINKSAKGQEGFNKTIRNLAVQVMKSVESFRGRSSSTLGRRTVLQRGSGFMSIELAPRMSDAEFTMEMTKSEKPKRNKFFSTGSEDSIRDMRRTFSAR